MGSGPNLRCGEGLVERARGDRATGAIMIRGCGFGAWIGSGWSRSEVMGCAFKAVWAKLEVAIRFMLLNNAPPKP